MPAFRGQGETGEMASVRSVRTPGLSRGTTSKAKSNYSVIPAKAGIHADGQSVTFVSFAVFTHSFASDLPLAFMVHQKNGQ
jgi:hypothetical protein